MEGGPKVSAAVCQEAKDLYRCHDGETSTMTAASRKSITDGRILWELVQDFMSRDSAERPAGSVLGLQRSRVPLWRRHTVPFSVSFLAVKLRPVDHLGPAKANGPRQGPGSGLAADSWRHSAKRCSHDAAGPR